jgi:hypothetical protein
MAAPKVEVFHDRDPDSACGITVYIDGKPVEHTEFSVDPGAGYEFREYAESLARQVASASAGLRGLIYESATAALESRYVEHKPADCRAAQRYFDLWILEIEKERAAGPCVVTGDGC